MANVTVKNIPDELYERLKDLAAENRRSINSQIIICIEQAVASTKADPNYFLEQARRLREKTASYNLTEEELQSAKDEGRP